MGISELRGKEALSIAPDFAADLGRDLVVNRIGEILRRAIRAGVRAIIVSLVEVGDRG